MLFHLTKTRRGLTYLLFTLIAAALWLLNLSETMTSRFHEGENQMVLFRPLFRIAENYPGYATAASLLLMIISAVLLQRTSNEYGFFRSKTVIPFTVFLLTATGFADIHILHPVHFAVVLLILAIYRLFAAFDIRKPYSQVFDAGFLLGSGSLFYLGTLSILPAFILGGSILGRETRWREIILTIAGFFTPWVFASSWFFLTGRQNELNQIILVNIVTENDLLQGNYKLIAFLGYLLLLTLIGSFSILSQYEEKKISLRQYYLVLLLIFIFAALPVFVVPASSAEAFLLAAVPVTLLLSNLMISFRKNLPGEIIIYALLALALFTRL